MKLTPGERERLKTYFNLFLAAQKRCSMATVQGQIKAHTFAAFVIAFGFVLGDEGQFEKNLQMWVKDIDSFGVITEAELGGEGQ